MSDPRGRPKLRKRLLVDEWVIIAPDRAHRPRQLELEDQPGGNSPCPFCPEQEHVTPPTISSWQSSAYRCQPWGVRAIPNKFPALRVEESLQAQGDHLYKSQAGLGAHEVIVESPKHHRHFHELPRSHRQLVVRAWRDRMLDLRRDQRLRCALLFKNQGARAGATLEHVHSQLVALPIVPPALARELRGARAHYDQHRRCALCEMVQRERQANTRMVADNDTMIAIAPFGSRMPFEIWLLPKHHGGDFLSASDDELDGLADLSAEILSLWRRALGGVSYNLILHSLPFDLTGEPYYHWHLEMLPRTGQVAGFEWGTNIFINATASEVAATHLRSLKT